MAELLQRQPATKVVYEGPMSDENPDSEAIAELTRLVQRLEQRVVDLTDEVQALRARDRKPRWGRPKPSRPSSVELWDELWSAPLEQLPPRLQEGDHWDLLWRDEPEDHLWDTDAIGNPDEDPYDDDPDEDPNDDGGSRVPAWPLDQPPDRSGGMALPLPPEEYGDVLEGREPDRWPVPGATEASQQRLWRQTGRR